MTAFSEAIKTGSCGASGALPASGSLGAIRLIPEDLGWDEGRHSRARRSPADGDSVHSVMWSGLWDEIDWDVILFSFEYAFFGDSGGGQCG